MFGFLGRHKVITGILLVVLAIVAVVAWRTIGPHRFYEVDFVKPAAGDGTAADNLLVGVAIRDITPNLEAYDPWTDANGDGRYREKDGDTFEDKNGNGRFDTVWMAGFNSDRPAQAVHDPLWARAIAFRNNGVTFAMVTIDSIGLLHEKIIDIRKSIDPALGIDHVMFSCTHNHEAPDTMGIWSNGFPPKFDHQYLYYVKLMCKEAVEEAVANLKPADMVAAQVEIEPEGFVDDSRQPIVYDLQMCCARFVEAGTDKTIGTVVSWGNHVETLGGSNTELTSDFAHYLRDAVEKGVADPNGVKGLGGKCLFFQGMVGGLMTQLHTDVPHRDGERVFSEASFDKAQALGENVGIVVVNALNGESAFREDNPKVAAAAKTIYAPIRGLYGLACFLGLIHPGWYWGNAKTEINVLRVGELEILTIPGELYPEIAEGGVESPEGSDFGIEPVEVPPLRGEMQGRVKMVIGLANDEIGYIIPKSQWDVEPPFAYGREKAQYGEENSGGPDVAGVIHRESLALLKRVHEAF